MDSVMTASQIDTRGSLKSSISSITTVDIFYQEEIIAKKEVRYRDGRFTI